jgi:anti-anti-sigma factor
VLTFAGEVDLAMGPRLRAALAELLERADATPIIIDLTRVTFLGSTGIAVLVDTHWQAGQLNIPLKIIVAADGLVLRTLRTSGVDHHLALHHDLATAVRELNTHI